MKHTPYGYKIVNGEAVIDDVKAEQIRMLFKLYLDGAGLATCSKETEINKTHASIGRMLRDEKYLGTEFYPAIIDKESFVAAEAERMKRAKALGRIYEYQEDGQEVKLYQYRLGKVEQKFDNPFEQAEYAYSQIEREG